MIFEDGTDIYFARQLVNERLQEARAQAAAGHRAARWARSRPASARSSCGRWSAKPGATNPDGTAVHATGPAHDPGLDHQAAAAHRAGRRPRSTPSAATSKQYHVTPDPEKLIAYGLTFRDVLEALARNNANVGAGYIEQQRRAVPDPRAGPGRGPRGHPANRRRHPRRRARFACSDVADVRLGEELRTGAATENGKEVVLGTAFMLIGENSRTVSRAWPHKLEEVNRTLPPGVVAQDRLRPHRPGRRDPRHGAARTSLEGALLVIVVLFLLAGQRPGGAHHRAASSRCRCSSPSPAWCERGISGNLMSLGAIDFGIIVDGAVVMVENCMRRLAAGAAASSAAC